MCDDVDVTLLSGSLFYPSQTHSNFTPARISFFRPNLGDSIRPLNNEWISKLVLFIRKQAMKWIMRYRLNALINKFVHTTAWKCCHSFYIGSLLEVSIHTIYLGVMKPWFENSYADVQSWLLTVVMNLRYMDANQRQRNFPSTRENACLWIHLRRPYTIFESFAWSTNDFRIWRTYSEGYRGVSHVPHAPRVCFITLRSSNGRSRSRYTRYGWTISLHLPVHKLLIFIECPT